MAAKPTANGVNNKPQSLDLQMLEGMAEPLTVQIDRIKNNQRSPIPMPVNPGSGLSPGQGYSKEEVQAIEQGWLVNEWAGGGLYIATVTDSSMPPQKMEWRMFWNPTDFPEKIPPTLAGSARLQVVPPPVTNPQPVPQVPSMGAFPQGLPSGGVIAPQPQAQPIYGQPPQGYGYGYPPPPPQYGYYPAPAAPQSTSNEVKALQEQLFAARLETQAREHQAALDRERAANASAIARLEQRIEQMARDNTAAVAAAPRGPDPAVIAAQEAARAAQTRLEQMERDREADRREALARDQMREMREGMQRQIEAITAQVNAQIAAMSANKGSDPMLQMMMEQNRNFIASLGEMSRNSGAQLDKLQSFMLAPRDIIAMQKDASNGLDGLTNKISSVYGNVMDMQQRVIENAMQLNQGGSETVGLIRDGLTNAKEMFERYIGGKARSEQVTQQSQAQAAIAAAQAQAIQAQSQVEMERIRSAPPTPPVRPMPQPTARAANGLNGQPQPANGNSFEEWQRQRSAQTVQATAPTVSPSGQATVPAGGERTFHGRTDEQWFTPAFVGELNTLRQGVVMFLEGLAKNQIIGATPEAVVDGIMQAQAASALQGIALPAINELLNQGEYEKFLDVLVPDAPETYREDVAKLLRSKLGDVEDDDDNDDANPGDEDGEDGDDVRDGSVTPLQKPAPRKPAIRPVS